MQNINLDTINTLIAQGTGRNPVTRTRGIELNNPLGTQTFTSLLDNIIGFLIAVSIPLAAALIVWGGFQIMTAGGNPNKINEGKNTILYTIIGFAVVLLSWGIVKILERILGVTSPR